MTENGPESSSGPPSAPVSVLLADPFALIREALHHRLEAEASVNVVAEAAGGDDLLRLTERFQPAVIVLGPTLSAADGTHLTRQVAERFPGIGFVLFSAPDAIPVETLQDIDVAYVSRDSLSSDLIIAVHMMAGRRAEDAVNQTIAEAWWGDRPTPRELEVLNLVALGLSNPEIAGKLGIRYRTVQFHLSQIFGKLGVNSRTAAVHEARQRGWIGR